MVLSLVVGCATEPAPAVLRMPRVSPAPSTPLVTVGFATVVHEAIANIKGGKFEAAAQEIRRLAPDQRAPALHAVIDAVAQHDPRPAARLLLIVPEDWLQSLGIETIGRALTDVDLLEAVEWALAVPLVSARVEAIRAVADRLLEREGPAALPRLAKLPVAARRDELLSLAAARWAKRDAAAALGWTRGLPEGEERRRLLTSVGFEIAQSMPERAVPVAEELPAGRDRWLLLGEIGRTMAARDADAAWAWAGRLPAGEAREAARAGIEHGMAVRGGLAYTPPPALASSAASGTRAGSLNTLARAESTRRDREDMLRREFEQRLSFSPVQAADWLSSLPAPDRKDEMVERLAREWLVTNPAAAQAWLEQNVPSEAWRRHLLQQAAAR